MDGTFVDADHSLEDVIDAVYREKYRSSGARFVEPMVSQEARSTTTKPVRSD